MSGTLAYDWGYEDGLDGRLRPYELCGSIAHFDWAAYDDGRRDGERNRRIIDREDEIAARLATARQRMKDEQP